MRSDEPHHAFTCLTPHNSEVPGVCCRLFLYEYFNLRMTQCPFQIISASATIEVLWRKQPDAPAAEISAEEPSAENVASEEPAAEITVPDAAACEDAGSEAYEDLAAPSAGDSAQYSEAA